MNPKEIVKNINQLIHPIVRYPEPDNKCNISIYSTPRSGSTWLLELLSRENNTTYCFEPFDVRRVEVRKKMKNIGVDNWDELYALQTLKKLKNYKVLEKGYLKGSNPTMLDLKRWKLGLISNDFNLLSNRVIFKFLHYGFNCVDLLNNLTKSESIALIRHPIAVSLSRTVAPRLSVMLSSEIIDPYLSEKQKQIAQHLQKENDPFTNKILEWCVQNKILLNQREKFKTILNYEELVLYPEQIINHLKKKFDLNFEYSEKDYTKASKTTLINSKKQFDKSSIPSKNSNLRLEKWRSKINVEDEKKVFQILDLFEIDFYEFGKNIPNEKFLVL